MRSPAMAATHLALDPDLAGRVVELAAGMAHLELWCSEAMRADSQGLVHGGFVFSLADHAAMLAINHPNVVLGSAQVKFLRPVQVGERLIARAALARQEGAKQVVEVFVQRVRSGESRPPDSDSSTVFTGEFICFVPPRHVLESAPEAAAKLALNAPRDQESGR